MTTYNLNSYSDPHVSAAPASNLTRWVQEEVVALANGDIVYAFKLPRYIQITGGGVEYDELDTNATPTGTASLQLFDGNTTAVNMITNFDLGAASHLDAHVVAQSGWMGHVTDDGDWVVRVLVTAALATAAAGTLAVWITYNRSVTRDSTVSSA